MQRVELRKLAASKEEYADKQLTVAGWVRTIRTSKNLGFIELNDGTCFQNLQVVRWKILMKSASSTLVLPLL